MKITVEGKDLALRKYRKDDPMSAAELMRRLLRDYPGFQIVGIEEAKGNIKVILSSEPEPVATVGPGTSPLPYQLPTRHFGARSDLDLTRLAHADEDAD